MLSLGESLKRRRETLDLLPGLPVVPTTPIPSAPPPPPSAPAALPAPPVAGAGGPPVHLSAHAALSASRGNLSEAEKAVLRATSIVNGALPAALRARAPLPSHCVRLCGCRQTVRAVSR